MNMTHRFATLALALVGCSAEHAESAARAEPDPPRAIEHRLQLDEHGDPSPKHRGSHREVEDAIGTDAYRGAMRLGVLTTAHINGLWNSEETRDLAVSDDEFDRIQRAWGMTPASMRDGVRAVRADAQSGSPKRRRVLRGELDAGGTRHHVSFTYERGGMW